MKRIFVLFLFAVTTLGLTACQEVEAIDPDNVDKIVVGLEAAYAPFNWTTTVENDYTVALHGQSGAYVDGYDVWIASRIAEALGAELVIKQIDWDGLIPSLESGNIDLIIAGMSPTSERAQTVLFSTEYYRSEQVMVVLNSSQFANSTSINDFTGARVVAQSGTLQDDLIDQIPEVVHRTPLSTYSFLLQEVVSGTADAFVAELPVALAMAATNSNVAIVQFDGNNGFAVTDEDVIVSIAMRLVDKNLRNAINEILNGITSPEREQMMTAALGRQPQENAN
ncbi:MAG: transporter substrate-binding domain-containing protein [Acholeplasmataceae bacterium]|nr:transporter substrate-binding domain-containing protein [Acholeplasmataceae bacterium]